MVRLELEKIKKEYNNLLVKYQELVAIHNKCPDIIAKLKLEIRELLIKIQELESRKMIIKQKSESS